MRELFAVARRGHGIFTTFEARAAGVTGDALTRLCRAGIIERLHPTVYRVAGTPITWRQRVAGAVRSTPGSLASHRCAAALWGLRGFERAPVELLVERWHRRHRALSGVIVHETIHLTDTDRSTVAGIPTTSVARTLIDAAGVAPERRVGDALDHALRRDPTLAPIVAARHLELASPGRRGSASMARILARRGLGAEPIDSALERTILDAIVDSGLPAPVLQHAVDLGLTTVFLDLSWPEVLLALECDGYEFHGDRSSFDWDRRRRRLLAGQGWCVLEATWADRRGEALHELLEQVRQQLVLRHHPAMCA
jgi:hypothetical protein